MPPIAAVSTVLGTAHAVRTNLENVSHDPVGTATQAGTKAFLEPGLRHLGNG
jgi:hypothetical protein